MSFTEAPFLILFAIVYPIWLASRGKRYFQAGLLLTCSLVFYGYHERWLLLLLLLYCVVNWAVALWVEISHRPKLVLGLGVAFNLLVLGYWKYTPMLLQSAMSLGWLTVNSSATTGLNSWVIPFGISFYAFTGIAYMVDVYRHVVPAERNFWRYTLSAVFFPHLVAGPILRADDFLTKLTPETMPTQPEAPLEALTLLARGYFKKMVLAHRLSLAIDPFFVHVSDSTTAGVWALPFVYLYALQIYLDFSAYTDLARGFGLLFGFRWPDNFNLPYLANSIQDFWRRWHITLSLFLRDYLYIPLGGNRGNRWRTNLNLMITMLLGGIWHGASWSFLLWGGLHGLFLVLNRAWAECRLGQLSRQWTGFRGTLWRCVCLVLTFHCICLAWCFFRLTVLSDSLICVRKWFVFDADKLFVGGSADLSLWFVLALYGLGAWLLTHCQWRVATLPTLTGPLQRGLTWGFVLALLALALLLSPGGEKPPFIYFQF